jgi:Nucleotidyl transferase AbiEii toxin, Type IV TA system
LANPAPKNVPASVRQKLLDLARKRNADFGLLLVKYGLERMLYRLSCSRHRDVFILKGALLFELWTDQGYRPTRDADFLARGDNSPERFVRIFQELCTMKSEADGLVFDAGTVAAERITEDADYEGVRVTFTAHLDRAKIPMQIDIGFGDAVTPPPVENTYPTLLEFPGPRLLTYPRETVVAEKLEAMVKLGIANSRMKDFTISKSWPAPSRSMERPWPRLYKIPSGTAARNCRPASLSPLRPSFIRIGTKSSNGRPSAQRTRPTSSPLNSKR